MDTNTFISSATLFITTTMSILASAVIAYLTFRHQNQKTLVSLERLREINRDTAIELFNAQIANLIFFLPEGNVDFSKETLSLYCKKLQIIEKHLSDLNNSDLPDTFISRFQYYRLKTSLTRITIEHRLEYCPSNILPQDSFHDLQIAELIRDMNSFVTVNLKA